MNVWYEVYDNKWNLICEAMDVVNTDAWNNFLFCVSLWPEMEVTLYVNLTVR